MTRSELADRAPRRASHALQDELANHAHKAWMSTDGFRAVVIPAGPGVEPGALLEVVIERATSATLFGSPVAPV